MNLRRGKWIGISTALLIIAGYSIVRAGSEPTYGEPPLLFSGMLSDAAGPLSGSHQIALSLWKSSDTSTASNLVCQGSAAAVDVNAGNFQVPLDATCAAAFAQYRQIFYQVTVDGTAFPAQQVGGVPFALHSLSDPIEGSRLVPQKTFQYGDDGYRGPLSYSSFFDKGRNEACNLGQTYESGQTVTRCTPNGAIVDPVPVTGLNGFPVIYSDPGCTTPFPDGRYYWGTGYTYRFDLYPNAPGGITAAHAMTAEGPFDAYYMASNFPNPPSCTREPNQIYRSTDVGDVPLTDFVRLQNWPQ
jgi:hypothetical protein